VSFVYMKLEEVYEGRTKICKLVCVGIYMAIM
jgi:hypothetical protein